MEKNAPAEYQIAENFAGFGRRFLAFLLDGLILSALAFGLAFLMTPAAQTTISPSGFRAAAAAPNILLYRLLHALMWWLYFAVSESSGAQATPGKRLLNLKITDLAGNRVSFYRATVRHFCKLISAFTLLIGFLMAAFTARRQALHDLMAGTLVLKKKPVILAPEEKQPGFGNLR